MRKIPRCFWVILFCFGFASVCYRERDATSKDSGAQKSDKPSFRSVVDDLSKVERSYSMQRNQLEGTYPFYRKEQFFFLWLTLLKDGENVIEPQRTTQIEELRAERDRLRVIVQMKSEQMGEALRIMRLLLQDINMDSGCKVESRPKIGINPMKNWITAIFAQLPKKVSFSYFWQFIFLLFFVFTYLNWFLTSNFFFFLPIFSISISYTATFSFNVTSFSTSVPTSFHFLLRSILRYMSNSKFYF